MNDDDGLTWKCLRKYMGRLYKIQKVRYSVSWAGWGAVYQSLTWSWPRLTSAMAHDASAAWVLSVLTSSRSRVSSRRSLTMSFLSVAMSRSCACCFSCITLIIDLQHSAILLYRCWVSVCLSVTLCYCIWTNARIVELFLPYDNGIILVLSDSPPLHNSKGDRLIGGGVKYTA